MDHPLPSLCSSGRSACWQLRGQHNDSNSVAESDEEESSDDGQPDSDDKAFQKSEGDEYPPGDDPTAIPNQKSQSENEANEEK